MWETIELREIRVFLTLAEELHFGRTAGRLGLTQSRVSQSLRGLEQKLGVQLVVRTSRRVALTPAGERFRDEAGAAHMALAGVLRSTHDDARRLAGELRVGMINAAAGGPQMFALVEAFEERYPQCTVTVVELPFADRYAPLRDGDVHAAVVRLPLEQPGIVVGPVLLREGRVLAVASDSPLAAQESVSVEVLADHAVAAADGLLPPEQAESFLPRRTPSGRPIPRVPLPSPDLGSIITLVARGRIVHPTTELFGANYGHPRVVFVPIHDMPQTASALAWRRRDPDPRLRAFIALAKERLS